MIDEKILQNIISNLISSSMREVREDKQLLDSFSPNQFLSKLNLINHIRSLDILNKDSEIVIFGGWYGSILIPAFYNEVKKITLIDKDNKVISRAKHNLFKDTDVEFICDDIFEDFRDQFKTTDLFINTSCENMKPMRDWGPAPQYKNPWWDRVSNREKPAYFAFQSHNIFDIHDSYNCVNNIEEFKKQLPDRAEVLIEDSIPFETGTRFTLIGKI
jgi:hypothetical protein